MPGGEAVCARHLAEQADARMLGQAVRLLRGRRGLTQQQLAMRGALKPQQISALEQGRSNPTFRILLAVSDGLGVKASQLLAEAEAQWPGPQGLQRRSGP